MHLCLNVTLSSVTLGSKTSYLTLGSRRSLLAPAAATAQHRWRCSWAVESAKFKTGHCPLRLAFSPNLAVVLGCRCRCWLSSVAFVVDPSGTALEGSPRKVIRAPCPNVNDVGRPCLGQRVNFIIVVCSPNFRECNTFEPKGPCQCISATEKRPRHPCAALAAYPGARLDQ